MEIWPEHARAVALFQAMSTQWRVGMSGCTGLDKGVLYRRMDRMSLSPEEYDQLEQDIDVLERGALTEIHKKDD